MATLNIEEPAELVRYLREAGHVPPGETPTVQCLSGGVSNRTVLVFLLRNQYEEGTKFRFALKVTQKLTLVFQGLKMYNIITHCNNLN